ncbi:MAG: hypothetical protein HY841_04845 [Bacteroidetes bacterium]|nr:hypothetical protein [Bacteroidota bacterium]
MKTSSDDLFRLIKSLDSREKTHFKIFSKHGNANYGYLNLFDIINSQEGYYDEEKVKSKLKDKSRIKNLKHIKSRLSEAILKFLEQYHSADSVNAVLRSYIHRIELMSSKRLFRTAKKILAKAEKLAAENYCYDSMGIVLMLKRDITLAEANLSEMRDYPTTLYGKESVNTELLKNLIDYGKLNIQVSSAALTQLPVSEEKRLVLKKLLKDPLLKNKNKALSFPATLLFYDISGGVNFMLNNWKKSYQLYKNVVRLMEQNPALLKSKTEFYITVVRRLLMIMERLGKGKELIHRYTTTKDFFKSHPAKLKSNSLSRLFMQINNNYIHYHLQSFNIKEALSVSEEFLSDIKKQYDTQLFLVFHKNLFLIYFYLNDYHKALQMLNEILNIKETGVRLDIINECKILNIIVHYELGNDDILPSLCKSAIRYFDKHKEDNKVEKILLSFFSNTTHSFNNNKITAQKNASAYGREKVKTFMELKRNLESYKTEMQTNDFDFLSWIDSKIKNRPFAEVVKGKANVEI